MQFVYVLMRIPALRTAMMIMMVILHMHHIALDPFAYHSSHIM